MTRDDQHDIDERSVRFFCDVIAFVETVPLGARTSRIIEQLVDAAGSIGTNRDEANGGSSRGEFIQFTRTRFAVRTTPSTGCRCVRTGSSGRRRSA